MAMIETLKAQHEELRQLSESILAAVHADGLTADVVTVRTRLLRLFGRLSVHLTTEDEHVYPILAHHADHRVRAVTGRFQQELGGLARALDSYKASWLHEKAIRDRPDDFVHHTRLLLAALDQRITREEEELYALLERR